MNTTNTVILAILAVAAMFVIAATIGVFIDSGSSSETSDDGDTMIQRHEFPEDGVVCYTWDKWSSTSNDNQMECVKVET